LSISTFEKFSINEDTEELTDLEKKLSLSDACSNSDSISTIGDPAPGIHVSVIFAMFAL
jgi:hypothetical protein